jgi:hypothetical protein
LPLELRQASRPIAEGQVVVGASNRVIQDLVRLGDLYERLVARRLVRIDVGMVLARQLAEAPAYLLRRRRWLHAQYLIVRLFHASARRYCVSAMIPL